MKEFHANTHREGTKKRNKPGKMFLHQGLLFHHNLGLISVQREGRKEGKSVCALNQNWCHFIFSTLWDVHRMYVYVCEWWHVFTCGSQRTISVLLR